VSGCKVDSEICPRDGDHCHLGGSIRDRSGYWAAHADRDRTCPKLDIQACRRPVGLPDLPEFKMGRQSGICRADYSDTGSEFAPTTPARTSNCTIQFQWARLSTGASSLSGLWAYLLFQHSHHGLLRRRLEAAPRSPRIRGRGRQWLKRQLARHRPQAGLSINHNPSPVSPQARSVSFLRSES